MEDSKVQQALLLIPVKLGLLFFSAQTPAVSPPPVAARYETHQCPIEVRKKERNAAEIKLEVALKTPAAGPKQDRP